LFHQLIKPISSEYADYLRDESRTAGTADSISFPENESDLAAILKVCHQTGTRVTVQGARTGLTAAAVPDGGHILNLSRMNRVRGMRQDPSGRFRLLVEPGVVLSRLRKQIEDRRFLTTGWDDFSFEVYRRFQAAPLQFFTPDPTETTASIGGMVACNASGARSYKYGATRNYVHALRLVLANGDSLALTRGQVQARERSLTLQTEQGHSIQVALPTYTMPVTKSASGYFAADNMDAVDLFIGSDGTLGVISQVELILLPLPQVIWGVTCFFSQEEQALEFVKTIRQEGDPQLTAIEYFDERVLRLLAAQKAANPAYARLLLPAPGFQCAIYCELQGDQESSVQKSLLRLGDAMHATGSDTGDSWVARTAFDKDQLIFFRHAAPECVNSVIDLRRREEPAITKLGTDMSVPDVYLDQVMALYHSSLAESCLESAIWGHIGNNHVHVNILPRNIAEYKEGKRLYRFWAEQIVAMGGAVSAEHGVGKLKAEYLALMYGKRHLAEMARVKAVFDPEGLLGAGNLFAAATIKEHKNT
jgi:D-lactate dehydrogenase (cytochrome)